MTIRTAVSGDIPELKRLLHQVGDVHHHIRPDLFRENAIKYDDDTVLKVLIGNTIEPIFVAMDGDTMLGYCFCQWRKFEGSTVLNPRQELYIDDLCVDEAYRGKGVAEALFHHACAYARAQGDQFVTLNVWCGNDRAMKFYEKMGMKPRNISMELRLEDLEC